jgi:hypothetical protein
MNFASAQVNKEQNIISDQTSGSYDFSGEKATRRNNMLMSFNEGCRGVKKVFPF